MLQIIPTVRNANKVSLTPRQSCSTSRTQPPTNHTTVEPAIGHSSTKKASTSIWLRAPNISTGRNPITKRSSSSVHNIHSVDYPMSQTIWCSICDCPAHRVRRLQ